MNAIVKHDGESVVVYDDNRVSLIKRTIAKGASDDELALFVQQCKRTGLDPFARQIYAIKRYDAQQRRDVMQTQTSIDGFRVIADRSGKYAGQVGPFWCGEDGQWRDVWLSRQPPAAARVGVLRVDFKEPVWGVARYDEYVQTVREGGPNRMWAQMPANQLAKCAEALALRKAFPQDLSGLYTADEMGQADNAPTITVQTEEQAPSEQPEETVQHRQPPKNTGDMSGKFHKQVTNAFGGFDIEEARHWYIARYTNGAAASSTALSDDQMAEMIEDLRKNVRNLRSQFQEWKSDQAEQTEEVTVLA